MEAHGENKVIIALDVDTKNKALDLVDRLEAARMFKVGLELFTAEGPSLLRELKQRGKQVFLDLKLHDIPNTVAGAVSAGTAHGIQMMTLHASGGLGMMRSARDAAEAASQKSGLRRPLLLGVTVLTSLKSQELAAIGMTADTEAQVLRLARLSREAGLDGVVCSPWEIDLIKEECGRDFLVVTPGIRPAWAAAQDQKRIMTPAQALQRGADYIVVGRPVTQAESPAGAFEAIIKELEES